MISYDTYYSTCVCTGHFGLFDMSSSILHLLHLLRLLDIQYILPVTVGTVFEQEGRFG